jgi:hypothetical protein
MVKRRRNSRNKSVRKSSPKKRYGSKKNKTLKENLLTTSIWVLSLVNILLIISLVSNFFASPNEESVSINVDSTKEIANSEITVEVLNACGVQGLANQITQYLRGLEFDVVNVGNYQGGFNLDRTFVFDRVSLDNTNAKKVAAALGVSTDQVAPQLDKSLQLEVTVIIGRDYRKLNVFAENL